MRTLLPQTFTVLLLLSGCAATPYGSFLPKGDDATGRALALDAAAKLKIEYPPSEHSIHLAANTDESFDRAFSAALRTSGYALHRSETAESGRLNLRYVVDRIKDSELLRVTLYVQGRTLSRAYASRSSGVFPAGPWSSGVHRG